MQVYHQILSLCTVTGVDIQPSVPIIPTLEGDSGGIGGPGRPGGDGGTNNGGGGDGGDGGSDGGDSSGDSGGDDQVMVCIELATGNLQRNVTVTVMTISSPTSTGNQYNYYSLPSPNSLSTTILHNYRTGFT